MWTVTTAPASTHWELHNLFRSDTIKNKFYLNFQIQFVNLFLDTKTRNTVEGIFNKFNIILFCLSKKNKKIITFGLFQYFTFTSLYYHIVGLYQASWILFVFYYPSKTSKLLYLDFAFKSSFPRKVTFGDQKTTIPCAWDLFSVMFCLRIW